MDKRYNRLSLAQQLALRKQAVDDVLAHSEWSLQEVVHHLKTSLRLITAEFATLAGVFFRTLQNLERGQSPGTVQTMNRVLSALGLRLGVVRENGPERRSLEALVR